MASLTEIYNMALYMIGDNPIMDPTDMATDRGKICSGLYPMVRDSVLRDYPWRCARVRAILPQDVEKPKFGYAYQYTLPTDPKCIWVPKFLNENFEYEIEGNKILTNSPTCEIVYISRPNSTESFDSLLTECIALRLAAQIAPVLTGKANLSEILLKLYQFKINNAYYSDSVEGATKMIENDILTKVR